MIRRLGHRARLTWVSAITAGLLLAGVFAAVVVIVRQSELRSTEGLLARALTQARAEVTASPAAPDLSEVVASDPDLTLAAFDAKGREFAQAGRLRLSPHVEAGMRTLGAGILVVVASTQQGPIQIIGAETWGSKAESVRRLSFLLAGLWLPLTACAALVTWLAATVTFRPLDALAGQAERLSEQSLSERLTVAGDDEYSVFVARLNRFLDRLEDSVHRQQQFIADAAHELRTPLTVLRSRIETTLRRPRTEEEYRAALEVSLREAERLSALVEALLQSATPMLGPAGALDAEIGVERAHARWVDRFADARVRLDLLTLPLRVQVPDAEFDVLIDNLLSNALRASPPGSSCSISVGSGSLAKVQIVVEDEGPGIPEGLEEKIFERFVRGDAGRDRSEGGFGIGLAVCRRLVVARGGTIRAENRALGARFIVEYPVDQTTPKGLRL